MKKISKVLCIKEVLGSRGEVNYRKGQVYEMYTSRLGWKVVILEPATEPVSENSCYFASEFFGEYFEQVK
jgi:hypothetical protein